MSLSEDFHLLHKQLEENPAIAEKIVHLVENAPDSAERDGLLSLMYHEGIGYPVDFDKSCELAEKAIDGKDPLGYYMLGYMCDNAETPDQAEGGPRQRYDHYDAERFYERCAEIESRWRQYAILWLGDFFLDSARGGDPEIGIEYLESIAEDNAEAAAMLSDYYWDIVMPTNFDDEEYRKQLFKWTSVAAASDPEEYVYRIGCLYAEGIGCKLSFEKAAEKFEEASAYGDWRGARAIATILEDSIDENPDLDQSEKDKLTEEIALWNRLADELYAEEVANEDDDCIEED